MKTVLGFGLLRVEGRSMAPTIMPGDYVLLGRFRRQRPPRPGDIAVYADADGRRLVKRLVKRLTNGRFMVRGDGVLSAPSGDLGPVRAAALHGRVLHVIRPPGTRSGVRRRQPATWGSSE